jgi:hypothetical protein
VKEPTDMYDLHLKILSFKRKQIQTKIVGLINELDWIQIQHKNGSTNPIETRVWDTIVKRNFYSIESTLLQTKYPGFYWPSVFLIPYIKIWHDNIKE